MKMPSFVRPSSSPYTSPSAMALFTAGLVGAIAAIALPVAAQTTIALPPQVDTYSSDSRGYWFTAPKDFVITGVGVPTDASSGNQSIALLRLAAEPPLYDTTTNDFEVLFLTQDDPSPGMIPTHIAISAGDVIGVLGSRGDINSYGVSPYNSSIDGLPITIARLGMQFPLSSNAPRDLWTESGGSISRVFLQYGEIVKTPVAVKERPKRKIKKKKKKQRLSHRTVRPPRSTAPL